MRVLAISGSLRAASHNTALLRAAAQLAPEGVEVELYDGLDRLPPFNEDHESDLPVPEVARLRDAIASADAVLISTPEYNGTVHLTVRDLDLTRAFYERAVGLIATESEDGTIALGTGVSGAPPLVTLRGDASAPALDRRATGLFHMAILMPSRRDLAVALAR